VPQRRVVLCVLCVLVVCLPHLLLQRCTVNAARRRRLLRAAGCLLHSLSATPQGRALLLKRVPVAADSDPAASAGSGDTSSPVGVAAALALIDGPSAGAAAAAAVSLAVMLRAAAIASAGAIATAAALPHTCGGPGGARAWPPVADRLRAGGAREAWAEVVCALGMSTKRQQRRLR
jgi:hypothetical protein